MRISIYLFVFLLLLTTCIFAQGTNIDSLKYALNNAKHDTTRCSILNELIAAESDNNIWPAYNVQLIEIAKKNLINNTGELRKVYLSYYALALNNFGFLYIQQGDIAKSFDYFNKSLSIQKENNDKPGIAGSLINLGYLCRQQGNIAMALDFYHKALKIQIELNDKSGVATSYNNLGFVYDNQGEFIKALEYYSKSHDIYKEIKDKSGIASCCLNIASIYDNQGDLYYTGTKAESIKEGHRKALEFLNKSIAINEEINNQEGLASALNCIGKIYESSGDPLCIRSKEECKKESQKKALDFYIKSLKIREEINNKVGMAMSYFSIGELLETQGKINEAQRYALLSLKTAKELGYPENIKDAAYILKKIYEKQNRPQQALEMYELYIQMRDSVTNQENKKTTFKKQFQIEYEIQATKDSISNAAKTREEQFKHEQAITKQRFYTFSGLFGFILMLIVAGISLKAYKNKKRANQLLAQQNSEILQQKEEIITQRDEIETQRDKLGEQNILLEEQKTEITDSINYAKRIQQAVMPDFDQLFNGGNQYSVNGDALSLSKCKQSTDYQIPITDYFVFFKPKDIVSGDFYWATEFNDLLIITVADCTGHGVPGAFMSMLGISFLNEIVRKKEITQASKVLDELRTSVIDALKQKGDSGEQKDGMDSALCVINLTTLQMQFAGANNPVWIVNQFENLKMNQFGNVKTETGQFPNFQINAFPNLIGPVTELVEVKGDKMPIGIHSHMQPFTNQIYQLQKGDTIYLMSDGYEDQFGGPKRKKFLSKNLKNLLTVNSQLSMADQKQTLESTITDWIGNNEQIDDITILGVKI